MDSLQPFLCALAPIHSQKAYDKLRAQENSWLVTKTALSGVKPPEDVPPPELLTKLINKHRNQRGYCFVVNSDFEVQASVTDVDLENRCVIDRQFMILAQKYAANTVG